VLLSATTNAHFYLSWLLLNFVFLGPLALATMLYTATAANHAILPTKLRFTMGLSVVIGLAANIVLLFGAELVLGLFGPDYAREAAGSLRILALGVFPIIVKDHYVSICRALGRVKEAVVRVTIGSTLELGLAAVGGLLGGLDGLSLGWVLGVVVEAIYMGGSVLATARHEAQYSKASLEVDAGRTP
jgi:O-antigen/teichoic acid export membrane protein